MNTANRLSEFCRSTLMAALLFALIIPITTSSIQAQDADVTAGVDLVSTYVWRGVAYSGPSWQPSVELGASGFTLGAWGSQGYDGFQEMDLYAGYSFDFGLYLGITDYYYPGTPYFSYTEDPANGEFSSHAFELNGSYETEGFTFSGNYILNESSGAGSAGGDLYFEAGYGFNTVDVFIGAGDGWHSTSGDFKLVNIGVTASKTLEITDTFSVPLFGSVVLNPDTEQLYIFVGLSF